MAKTHGTEKDFQLDNHVNTFLDYLRIFESMLDNNQHEDWSQCGFEVQAPVGIAIEGNPYL